MTMLSDPVINDVVSVAETLASDVLIEVRNALESEKIQDELLKRIHEAGRAEAETQGVLVAAAAAQGMQHAGGERERVAAGVERDR